MDKLIIGYVLKTENGSYVHYDEGNQANSYPFVLVMQTPQFYQVYELGRLNYLNGLPFVAKHGGVVTPVYIDVD